MGKSVKCLANMFSDIYQKSTKIFIVGHDEPDYDAIASAIGLSELCQNVGIESYIIVNDNDIELEPGVKQIIDKEKDRCNIINLDRFEELMDNTASLITTDTNNQGLVSVRDYLEEFKDILIIDHHDESARTIDTDKKHIDLDSSSASEIVTNLLNSFKVKYSKDTANYLLSGIRLDTKRFKKNTSANTYDAVKKLLHRGADVDYVEDLFASEIDVDKDISLLIHDDHNTRIVEYGDPNFDRDNILLKGYNVSFTLNRTDPMKEYKKVVLAQTADRMIGFRTLDASFVLSYVNPNTICISGRSKGKIDVGEIMRHMDGGGGIRSAACRIENPEDIFEVEKELMQQIEWGLPKEDAKQLVKKPRKV
ncbi:MAG: DHH family phosphoesterase [Bacilli bacterium]|nr:DHH family phosphoesterase [Bacilli bacterium]